MDNKLVVFKGKEIRRILHNNEWWFSVADICGALTGNPDPGAYWRKLKQRLKEEGGEVVTFCHGLKLTAPDGKLRETDCANTEGIFRIIQSIPSPKPRLSRSNAGWPRSATSGSRRSKIRSWPLCARTKELYRGVNGEPEYAILTAEISKAAFGFTPTEYKNLKGLERENLRDHMTDLELIFSMLGEAATTEIARKQDAQGFCENKVAARKGGWIAGEAREKLEVETGENVVTPENYLTEPESKKRLDRLK